MSIPTNLRYIEVDSPLGSFRLEGTTDEIVYIWLPGTYRGNRPEIRSVGAGESYPAISAASSWISSYFEGSRKIWKGNLARTNGDFQRKVYEALVQVPYGATLSYGELARLAGSPGAARAVGRAMATNPLPLLVPCHRVIGADGGLCGFGGSPEMKRWLLKYEGVNIT